MCALLLTYLCTIVVAYCIGALGKKTRFQVEHKAQLVVKVSHVKESGSSPDISLPIVQNVTSVPKVPEIYIYGLI